MTVLVAKMKSRVSIVAPGSPREKKCGPHSATNVLIISYGLKVKIKIKFPLERTIFSMHTPLTHTCL